jgi:hypothetical protein
MSQTQFGDLAPDIAKIRAELASQNANKSKRPINMSIQKSRMLANNYLS